MGDRLPNVWYATPDRLRSMWKVWVLTDRGSLERSPDGIRFHGNRATVAVRTPTNVALVRQQLPWPTYVVGNLLFAAYYGFASRNRWDAGNLAVVMVAINAAILLIGLGTRWVEVQYRDEGGNLQRAYFADGSRWGWGGRLLGGTSRLVAFIGSRKEADAT